MGDPESGFWEQISRATKQGTWGTVSMFFAGHMGGNEFRSVASQVITNVLQNHDQHEISDAFWKFDVKQSLLSMLVEEYVACRFRVTPVLPSKFESIQQYVDDETALFPYGLANFYDIYLQIRKTLDTHFEYRNCGLFDFNEGLRWTPID